MKTTRAYFVFQVTALPSSRIGPQFLEKLSNYFRVVENVQALYFTQMFSTAESLISARLTRMRLIYWVNYTPMVAYLSRPIVTF